MEGGRGGGGGEEEEKDGVTVEKDLEKEKKDLRIITYKILSWRTWRNKQGKQWSRLDYRNLW